MKYPAILMLVISFCCMAEEKPADPDYLGRVETLGGKTYEDVSIRKVDPDGIAIFHKSGSARLRFEDLPDAIRERCGYDPAAASKHREQVAAAQVAYAARAQETARIRREAAAVAGKKDADEDHLKKVRLYGREVFVQAHQNSDIGLIGSISVKRPVKRAVPGSMVRTKIEWVHHSTVQGVMKGVRVPDLMWGGRAWPIGVINYATGQGVMRRCSLYTASESAAAAFYKAHGFPPKCDGVVTTAPGR